MRCASYPCPPHTASTRHDTTRTTAHTAHTRLTDAFHYSGLSHPNLVGLKGFCLRPACIVTELVEAGSLYDFLTDDAKSANLQWPLRLKIAKDIGNVSCRVVSCRVVCVSCRVRVVSCACRVRVVCVSCACRVRVVSCACRVRVVSCACRVVSCRVVRIVIVCARTHSQGMRLPAQRQSARHAPRSEVAQHLVGLHLPRRRRGGQGVRLWRLPQQRPTHRRTHRRLPSYAPCPPPPELRFVLCSSR
jgi:hypothetical protein